MNGIGNTFRARFRASDIVIQNSTLQNGITCRLQPGALVREGDPVPVFLLPWQVARREVEAGPLKIVMTGDLPRSHCQ